MSKLILANSKFDYDKKNNTVSYSDEKYKADVQYHFKPEDKNINDDDILKNFISSLRHEMFNQIKA